MPRPLTFRPTPAVATFVAAIGLAVASCVNRPEGRKVDGRTDDDAIGYVTVSSPLFVPINGAVTGDKRLQFGDLRKVETIAKALQTPSFRTDRVEYSLLEAALAARIAGAKVSMDQTTTTAPPEDDGDPDTPLPPATSRKRTENRTFESPDVPTAPGAPDLDAKVLDKLVALLDRSGQTLALPPDVLATLVAANQTYMTNLEEYHNVEALDFSSTAMNDYIPYKIHFTVTAEPGTTSRYFQYDAVTEIRFGDEALPEPGEADGCLPEILVLGVTPLETAETLSEFTAALNQTALALELEANTPKVGAAGSVDWLKAVAERLEGLRASKTLSVAFPDRDRVRIRFQAARSGVKPGRELQSISRMLTATVLVRNETRCKDKAWTYLDRSDTRSIQSERAAERRLMREFAPTIKGTAVPAAATIEREFAEALTRKGIDANQQSTLANASDEKIDLALAAFAELERSLSGPATAAIPEVIKKFRIELHKLREGVGRKLSIEVDSYYSPSVFDEDGDWSPPLQGWPDRPEERFTANPRARNNGTGHPPTRTLAWIPPWLGELRKPFEIKDARGFYAASLSAVAEADAQIAAAGVVESKKKEELATATRVLKDRQRREELDKEVVALTTKLGGASTGDRPALQAQIDEKKAASAALVKSLGDANQVSIGVLEAKQTEATTAVAAATTEVKSKTADYKKAWSAALANGKGDIRVAISSPRRTMRDDARVEADVWARVVWQGGGTASRFQRIGSGDIDRTLSIEPIDLGYLVPASTPDKPVSVSTLGSLSAFVEAWLVEYGDPTLDNLLPKELAKRNVLATATREVQIRPAPGSTGAGDSTNSKPKTGDPAKPEAADATKPQTTSPIQLKLDRVDIELGGSAGSPPAPATGGGNGAK